MTRDERTARLSLIRPTDIVVMASCGAVVSVPESGLGCDAAAPEYVPRSIRRHYKNAPAESPAEA